MSRTLLAFVMFIIAAASAATGLAAKEKTILVLGDSVSAGFGIAQEQSWPALLGQRLKAEGYPYKVANISISGETTSGGLSRLAPALQQHQPEILIIALGGNDGLRGLPLEQMRDNLNAMIRLGKEGHARVFLVGMQLPPNYGTDYTRQFRQIYADLARRQQVALEPFLFTGFAERRDAFQGDGIHPTAAAQPLVLENVWHGLKPLLRRQ